MPYTEYLFWLKKIKQLRCCPFLVHLVYFLLQACVCNFAKQETQSKVFFFVWICQGFSRYFFSSNRKYHSICAFREVQCETMQKLKNENSILKTSSISSFKHLQASDSCDYCDQGCML